MANSPKLYRELANEIDEKSKALYPGAKDVLAEYLLDVRNIICDALLLAARVSSRATPHDYLHAQIETMSVEGLRQRVACLANQGFLTADLLPACEVSAREHLWWVADHHLVETSKRGRAEGDYPWNEIPQIELGQLIPATFTWEENRQIAVKLGEEWHESYDIGLLEDWEDVRELFASKENAEAYASQLKGKDD